MTLPLEIPPLPIAQLWWTFIQDLVGAVEVADRLLPVCQADGAEVAGQLLARQ